MKNHNTFLQNFNGLAHKDRAGYFLNSYMTEGGQAWIFDARHNNTDGVAIKAFKEAHDEQTINDFKDEARRLQILSESEHIIGVDWLDSIPIQVGKGRAKTIEYHPYMAMEKANGGSVKDYIGNGRLESERALEWLVQAMEGIRYAHGEDRPDAQDTRITHRDIKPANLLIVNDKVKVADFGIAVAGHINDHTISGTQLAMGSPPFMAVEQFRGRAVLRSDIYAMGATGYRMLTGRLPIETEDTGPLAWFYAHETVTPKPHPLQLPDGRVDEIGMAMQEPLLKAMAKRTSDRYPSMGAFQDALIEAAEHGRQLQLAARTYINLGGAEPSASVYPVGENESSPDDATQHLTAPFTREHLLHELPEQAEAPEEAKQQQGHQLKVEEEKESPREKTRRQALNIFIGVAITTAVGGVAYEHFKDDTEAKDADKAAEKASQTESKNVLDTTKWLIDACKAHGQDNDVFFLVRALIPVDYKAAAKYIDQMPLDKASYLAADLAFYDPVAAEAIMKKYEAKTEYMGAARIAIALAFYAKQKPNDANSDFVSGAPLDPIRQQAKGAADRVNTQCNNADLQRAIDIAGSYNYAFSNFGTPTDIALEFADKHLAAGNHDLIEMLFRVIVRDNDTAVQRCLDYYVTEAAKNNADQEQMLARARDLAIDMAPFKAETVAKLLDTLQKTKTTAYSAAVDAIAMALAPYDANKVSKYVRNGFYTSPNRYPIGIAVAPTMVVFRSDLKRIAQEPVTSWLNFADNASKPQLAQKAKDALAKSVDLKNYGYWLGAALLKSQTEQQK